MRVLAKSVMAVLDSIKVVITNLDENHIEYLYIESNATPCEVRLFDSLFTRIFYKGL